MQPAHFSEGVIYRRAFYSMFYEATHMLLEIRCGWIMFQFNYIHLIL